MMGSSHFHNLALPGLKRRAKGKQLHQDGHVQCVFISSDLIVFEVKGSTGKHTVSILDGVARCGCPDFENRWQREFGAFTCQHIWGALEELNVLEAFFMKNNWMEDPENHFLLIHAKALADLKLELAKDLELKYKNFIERKVALEDVLPRANKKQKEALELDFYNRAVLPLQKIELAIVEGKDIDIVGD